jgi:hypothetical protein
MSSVIPMSPYCAREATGGTSVLPRTVVGKGEAVGDGAAIGEELAVSVGRVLAGVTQAPIANIAAIRRAAVLMAAIFRYRATCGVRRPNLYLLRQL